MFATTYSSALEVEATFGYSTTVSGCSSWLHSNYSCEAKILGRKIHLPAYYVSAMLHATCAIKLLYTVRIRVLILDSTSEALISTWQLTIYKLSRMCRWLRRILLGDRCTRGLLIIKNNTYAVYYTVLDAEHIDMKKESKSDKWVLMDNLTPSQISSSIIWQQNGYTGGWMFYSNDYSKQSEKYIWPCKTIK
jgi:hypothetical protein